MEPVYRVSSFKRLVDGIGHPVDACQGSLEPHAPSESRAIEIARTRFAGMGQTKAWRLPADHETVGFLPGWKRSLGMHGREPSRAIGPKHISFRPGAWEPAGFASPGTGP
jgi:hypothetical protein